MVSLSPTFIQPSSFPSKAKTCSSSPSSRQPRLRVSSAYTTTERNMSVSASASSSLYEVLGISTGASCNEIKAAYRKLARVCHPDVVATNKRDGSANEFIKIHEAYTTLLDPVKRETYDRDLYGRARRFGSLNSSMMAATAASMNMSSSRFSGFSRKRWESDQCW